MTRPLVVATQPVDEETRSYLGTFARPVVNPGPEPWPRDELLAVGGEAEALMVFMTDRVDAALLDACPRLRIVAGALKGYDNIDVAACTRRGVWLTIVDDLLTEPTADLLLGLLLGLARRIGSGDRLVRSGRFAGWRPHLYGVGLQGRRAGIIGFGRVGRAAARRLSAFGANVVHHDADAISADAESGSRRVSVDELRETSDFVIPLLPLTPETLLFFDAARLRHLKHGALLVNVARGSLVDEEAVADALETGALGGYAADVFAMEDWARPDRPHEVSPRLRALADRTLFTPHLGTAVADVRRAIEGQAARQIEQALAGRRPPGAVNDLR